MDEKLVPLPGEAAYERREDDLIHEPLVGVNYDDAWADLVPDSDGLIRTTLTEPHTGAGVAMWQDRGTVLIYTGGSYPVPRGSIAIEPVESTTDAFNRPDRDAEVRLAPGATRTFRFGGTVLE
jgi:aldose 1-epimerase